LIGSTQASPYARNKYPSTYAFDKSGNKFTHTNKGVGMWWRANFGENEIVAYVRILNRKSCCGNRLSGTIVSIGGQECGKVQNGAKNGKWYTVTCQKPIVGKNIELKTT
jgi:hypothetical protein